MKITKYLIVVALLLAGGAGFATSVALSSGKIIPAKTVTINVATGPIGPQGPPGPAGATGPPGPAGTTVTTTVATTTVTTTVPTMQCPTGFSEGEVVINHPGGQTIIWTCIHD